MSGPQSPTTSASASAPASARARIAVLVPAVPEYNVLAAAAAALPGVVRVVRTEPGLVCAGAAPEPLAVVLGELAAVADRIVLVDGTPHAAEPVLSAAMHAAGLDPALARVADLDTCRRVTPSLDTAQRDARLLRLLAMEVAAVAEAAPLARAVPDRLAVVAREYCDGCGICYSVCQYDAIRIETEPDGTKHAVIDAARCQECGLCVAACPSGAMDQHGFANRQVYAALDAALRHRPEGHPQVLVFMCEWCSYPAYAACAERGLELPASFVPVRFMCSGRIDPEFVLYALAKGFDGVLVTVGPPEGCHYKGGNYRTDRRVKLARRLLLQYGIDRARLGLALVREGDADALKAALDAFVATVQALGPMPPLGA